jgi:DNA polymerase-3 subunit delta'
MRCGIDERAAAQAAAAAHGRLDRAQLLAGDPGFADRQSRWRAIPDRLNGTGAAICEIVDELVSDTEALGAHVAAAQEAELEALAEQAKQRGERGVTGRAAIEARHRRELRRIRTDELRAGLGTLAQAYRDRLVVAPQPARRLSLLFEALGRIDECARWIERNPNEQLLLQCLLVDLDRPS